MASSESEAAILAERPDQAAYSPLPSDKWAAALERLGREDAEKFNLAKTSNRSPKEVLVDVLAAANEKKKESMRRRWKVVVKGRTIVLHDLLEKISVWVNKAMVRKNHPRHLFRDLVEKWAFVNRRFL